MTGESSGEAPLIDASRRRFIQATEGGDIEAILSLVCDDAVWMPPNEESLYGLEEIREWWEEYYDHFRVATVTDTDRELTMLDDGWALDCWTYILAIDGVKDGKRIRDDGRFLALWQLQAGGEWKMSKVMFNSMRRVGSGTGRFLVRLAHKRDKGAVGER